MPEFTHELDAMYATYQQEVGGVGGTDTRPPRPARAYGASPSPSPSPTPEARLSLPPKPSTPLHSNKASRRQKRTSPEELRAIIGATYGAPPGGGQPMRTARERTRAARELQGQQGQGGAARQRSRSGGQGSQASQARRRSVSASSAPQQRGVRSGSQGSAAPSLRERTRMQRQRQQHQQQQQQRMDERPVAWERSLRGGAPPPPSARRRSASAGSRRNTHHHQQQHHQQQQQQQQHQRQQFEDPRSTHDYPHPSPTQPTSCHSSPGSVQEYPARARSDRRHLSVSPAPSAAQPLPSGGRSRAPAPGVHRQEFRSSASVSPLREAGLSEPVSPQRCSEAEAIPYRSSSQPAVPWPYTRGRDTSVQTDPMEQPRLSQAPLLSLGSSSSGGFQGGPYRAAPRLPSQVLPTTVMGVQPLRSAHEAEPEEGRKVFPHLFGSSGARGGNTTARSTTDRGHTLQAVQSTHRSALATLQSNIPRQQPNPLSKTTLRRAPLQQQQDQQLLHQQQAHHSMPHSGYDSGSPLPRSGSRGLVRSESPMHVPPSTTSTIYPLSYSVGNPLDSRRSSSLGEAEQREQSVQSMMKRIEVLRSYLPKGASRQEAQRPKEPPPPGDAGAFKVYRSESPAGGDAGAVSLGSAQYHNSAPQLRSMWSSSPQYVT